MTIDDFTRAAWAKLIDREYLRELASGATPGPWENVWEEADEWYSITGQSYEEFVCPEVATLTDETDADFIAASRTAVPALLDALDQAEARIKAVRELHQPFEDKECGTVCTECSYFGGDYGLYPTDYPCDTIRALDGDQ